MFPLAIKAINDTIGPEIPVPTLLGFGTITRPARMEPATCQIEISKALEVASNSVRKYQTSRRIEFGLNHYERPKGIEDSEQLRNLRAISLIYVYLQETNKLEGPFTFM